MILDKLMTQNSVLESAMQGTMVRKDVILNNIANADTPGFKKKTVLFEESLKDSVRRYEQTGKLDLSNVSPTIQKMHSSLNYRIDENNVDIETEMIDLYETSVRYDTMANSVMNNYKRINSVLSAR